MLGNIHWLGHDSFRIEAGLVIYIDPFKLPAGSKPADLILITHDHFDHLSLEDIAKIQKPETEFVTNAVCAAKLKGKVHQVKAGDKITARGIALEVLPAYNTNKKFHPKAAGGLGFVLTVNGSRIYHAGDTDAISEMKDLKPDIALLPVSGTYVMDASEALDAIKLLQPKLVIPMHYGAIVGSEADALSLQKQSSVAVEILKPE